MSFVARAGQLLSQIGAFLGSARGLSRTAIVLGIILRLADYANNRALWLDEKYLGENVIGRPIFEFDRQMVHDQLAPPGFLVVARASSRVLGASPHALRFFPLVCGIASLFAARCRGPPLDRGASGAARAGAGGRLGRFDLLLHRVQAVYERPSGRALLPPARLGPRGEGVDPAPTGHGRGPRGRGDVVLAPLGVHARGGGALAGGPRGVGTAMAAARRPGGPGGGLGLEFRRVLRRVEPAARREPVHVDLVGLRVPPPAAAVARRRGAGLLAVRQRLLQPGGDRHPPGAARDRPAGARPVPPGMPLARGEATMGCARHPDRADRAGDDRLGLAPVSPSTAGSSCSWSPRSSSSWAKGPIWSADVSGGRRWPWWSCSS